jgi:hypothetical protein
MRKFEEVFSGRRWERKGSFNVYIFTFGRSVEFARFVLMMTGDRFRESMKKTRQKPAVGFFGQSGF